MYGNPWDSCVCLNDKIWERKWLKAHYFYYLHNQKVRFLIIYQLQVDTLRECGIPFPTRSVLLNDFGKIMTKYVGINVCKWAQMWEWVKHKSRVCPSIVVSSSRKHIVVSTNRKTWMKNVRSTIVLKSESKISVGLHFCRCSWHVVISKHQTRLLSKKRMCLVDIFRISHT